ncbi:MAG: hypothetical protein R3181_03745 [Rubricoccaceae bacterium]|nr:hypothetical protein [Rubricoccaceae bacterium]
MRLCLFLLLALLALALPARAQFEGSIGGDLPEAVVAWTASVRPPATAGADTGSFQRGDLAFVTFTAEVAPGWRLYSLDSPGGRPLQIALDGLPSGVRLEGQPSEDDPRDGFDETLRESYRYHAGRVRVWQALRIGPQTPRGTYDVSARLRYAACNDAVCLPPREAPLRATLVVD